MENKATEIVDQVARDSARDAVHDIKNFRAVNEIQLKQLDSKIDTNHLETGAKIDRIEGAIKWAGGLIVSLLLTVLGWAVLQQINANDSQKKEMSRQIELLRQQEEVRPGLPLSAPRAAQPANAPVGSGED